MAAVDVEVRTVPDETGELRADGLGSGGLLLELLEHAVAAIRAAINITDLGRMRPPWLLGLAARFSGPTLKDGARGMPVTEVGRECLLADLGVAVRCATTCDQTQSFHVLERGVARATFLTSKTLGQQK